MTAPELVPVPDPALLSQIAYLDQQIEERDSRLARIAALCDEWERHFLPGVPVVGVVRTDDLRAVLGGGPA